MGQTITWVDYHNGTQVIFISANGAPPLSPDTVLLILRELRKYGVDNTWICTSIEINVDSQQFHIDGNFSFQAIEGVILKVYQHGYSARVEVGYHRKAPITEIMNCIRLLAGSIDGKEALRKTRDLEARLDLCERNALSALDIARKGRTKQRGCSSGKKGSPGFQKASELQKQPTRVSNQEEGDNGGR